MRIYLFFLVLFLLCLFGLSVPTGKMWRRHSNNSGVWLGRRCHRCCRYAVCLSMHAPAVTRSLKRPRCSRRRYCSEFRAISTESSGEGCVELSHLIIMWKESAFDAAWICSVSTCCVMWIHIFIWSGKKFSKNYEKKKTKIQNNSKYVIFFV